MNAFTLSAVVTLENKGLSLGRLHRSGLDFIGAKWARDDQDYIFVIVRPAGGKDYRLLAVNISGPLASVVSFWREYQGRGQAMKALAAWADGHILPDWENTWTHVVIR